MFNFRLLHEDFFLLEKRRLSVVSFLFLVVCKTAWGFSHQLEYLSSKRRVERINFTHSPHCEIFEVIYSTPTPLRAQQSNPIAIALAEERCKHKFHQSLASVTSPKRMLTLLGRPFKRLFLLLVLPNNE